MVFFKLGEKLCYFYENWNEVPFKVFIKWQSLSLAISEKHGELSNFLNSIKERKAQADDYAKQGNIQLQAKMLQSALSLSAKFEEMKSAALKLEFEAIALFTDVPFATLVNMKDSANTDFGFNVNHSWVEKSKDTNSIYFYKSLFYLLARQPLSAKSSDGVIHWQTKTDTQIEELQKQYNALSFFSKLSSKGRKAKRELQAAISSKWQAVDLWEQTTYANSHFIKEARKIIDDMERGDWSKFEYLVCMVLVESNANKKAIDALSKENNPDGYIERYAAIYKSIYDQNHSLFFGQKQTLTVGHILSLKAFFCAVARGNNIVQRCF